MKKPDSEKNPEPVFLNEKSLKSEALTTEPGEAERLRKFYNEELRRKDKIIEELKSEREILIKTALRQAERNAVVSSKIRVHRKDRQE